MVVAENTADTFGWDTAFGIRVDDVNAAVVRAKSSPSVFTGGTVDPLSGTKVEVTGDFGDWQITLGGGGKLIHMRTPVPKMQMTAGSFDKTFTNGWFVIEVELHYVPYGDQPSDADAGTLHNLIVRSQKTARTTQQVVTVMRSSFSEPDYSGFSVDIEAAMQSWFNANLHDFEHVFATVNLGRTADRGQFAFVLPTYSSYAYINGSTTDNSILGILSMTDNRSPDGLVEEISPNIIPEGGRAGFLISQERFLSQMVMPSMPLVYKGAEVRDFQISNDNASIVLAGRKPISIATVTKNGKTANADLDDFRITTKAQNLIVNATTKATPSPGIYAYTKVTTTYQLQLHTTTSKKQTLFYKEVDHVKPQHWTKKGAGIEILNWVEDIVGALIVIVVGVLTAGAGLVPAALVVGILLGVANKIPDIIAAANTDAALPIDLLQFNCIDPLQWRDQKDFSLTSAQLNDALVLGGTPTFSGS